MVRAKTSRSARSRVRAEVRRPGSSDRGEDVGVRMASAMSQRRPSTQPATAAPTWDDVAMFERFTDRGRRVLVLAQEEARLLNHDFLGTEHILLGLIHESDGVAAKALEQMGIELGEVRAKVKETIGPSTLTGGPPTGSPPFTPRAKKVLELALREALQLGHNYIGTEHLLLGLMREGEGVGAQVLTSLGADSARVRQEVLNLLSSHQASGEQGYPPWEGDHRRRGRMVSCSFCGRQPPESGRLISGQSAYICEHCVRQWSEQLAEDADPESQ